MPLYYFFAALLIGLLCWVLRKLSPKLNIAFFSVLMLWMTGYWALYGNTLHFTWFVFVKFYSVFGALVFLNWLQINEIKQHHQQIVYAVLAINILEASICDMMRFSVVNGLAGILIILSQPSPNTVAKGPYQITYSTPMYWVLAYTLWNATFLYGNPHLNSMPLALLHLGLPLLFSLSSPANYLLNRSQCLALAIFLWVFPPARVYLDWPSSFYNEQLWSLLCWASLFCAAILVIMKYRKIGQGEYVYVIR